MYAVKYKGYPRVVEKVMAPLMANLLGGGRFHLVVPVPWHRARLAKRGFNQAELMARRVAERINALVLDKLKVVRRTRDQVELSAEQRRTNVLGAYTARGPVAGKILLVDDLHDWRHLERVCRSLEESGHQGGPSPDLCRTC